MRLITGVVGWEILNTQRCRGCEKRCSWLPIPCDLPSLEGLFLHSVPAYSITYPVAYPHQLGPPPPVTRSTVRSLSSSVPTCLVPIRSVPTSLILVGVTTFQSSWLVYDNGETNLEGRQSCRPSWWRKSPEFFSLSWHIFHPICEFRLAILLQ